MKCVPSTIYMYIICSCWNILGQYTTGRGSSGVGLTAAVMKDTVTGEMTLGTYGDEVVKCVSVFGDSNDYYIKEGHSVFQRRSRYLPFTEKK